MRVHLSSAQWKPSYLDLFSSDRLNIGLLSNGKRINQDFCPCGDRHFEAVAVLLNLRDALDVFAFLDELVRKPFNGKHHNYITVLN